MKKGPVDRSAGPSQSLVIRPQFRLPMKLKRNWNMFTKSR